MVLENLAGGDLFSFLEIRKFNISEQRAAAIIYSLLLALQYLHSYGIAHRDLKPENILMVDGTAESDVKIADFGLSKIIAPEEKSIEPFGTLSYVAPEVLKQEPYDKRVDLWSLGVISYLLISSTMPFDSDNNSEIGKMVLERIPNYQVGKWVTASEEAKDFTKSMNLYRTVS